MIDSENTKNSAVVVMNDKIKAISQVLCGIDAMCKKCGIKPHCEVTYKKAASIYTAHIKPLEDALAKAEEREKVLVEALEAAKSTLNLINSKMPGGVYYKKYEPVAVAAISKACTALATVKGEVC